jgi:class 3 adenylate cyclase
LHGVIDHFVRLLDFSPSDLQRTATETDGHLVPRMRKVSTPIAIFVDGIDEYFGKHIENRGTPSSVTGALSPSIWFLSQLGLMEVAYQLRRINHHIKVFAAIRKEAYERIQESVMSQQYRGSAIDIIYPVDSLRDIFVNNIRSEKSDRMILPDRLRRDPIGAFLGRTLIAHHYTYEQEDLFEYICRHTMLRPRDLMTIGQRLAALRPAERQNDYRFRETVNLAATEIAHEYLNEIAPYIRDLDLQALFPELPGQILTREQIRTLFMKHNERFGGFDEKHVFCGLYRVGLLGYVYHDRVRGERVQRFLRPGEGTLAPDGVLPDATHYLVHPVLSDVIGQVNPTYLQRIDRAKIVGYGRVWRDSATDERQISVETLCVLAADVHGFGGLMRAGTDLSVRQVLETAVRKKWGQESMVAETRDGDSVWMVHDDPVSLAEIARQLMDEVYRAPGQPRLRIILHYGEVRVRRDLNDGSRVIAGGDAVLCAARVEPHVEPGQIWATHEFQQQLAKTPSLWRSTPVLTSNGNDRLNVRKHLGTESDLWVRLFRLEF